MNTNAWAKIILEILATLKYAIRQYLPGILQEMLTNALNGVVLRLTNCAAE